MVLIAGFGAFVAARQSWLQWYPPEVVSCGRDFYGMIENFPLQRAIPMIFKGGGDCCKVDWTFLGGSIANWSFLCFLAVIAVSLVLIVRSHRPVDRADRAGMSGGPWLLGSIGARQWTCACCHHEGGRVLTVW